ncbi:origin recognition complex subunit 1 [Suhomyces tanzawaensis NRRL Y-17324]|uniref:Origin recognition complex subunit 1 n=1 Tax=Suhomyces tanzawaensis NRRL Y-17324 TaxID=984487 RepID=A0A1E4SML8_9ASCO|nr:origin recognition complex subunit 1 [Suhomyces tanzawaensis NRRL Y-17324]ODV80774.1 origin recognition complex subunit 1 [Suhomyces tanzawaensis NRRL Y-17324]
MIKGWNYSLGEEPVSTTVSTPRRSRRAQPIAQSITLKRDSDGLEIKPGDCLMVQQSKLSAEVAFVKEIKFGSSKFIDVVVLWFIRAKDIDPARLQGPLNHHELFLTPYLEDIELTDIIDKVNVVSEQELAADIVVDESNLGTTFMTRKGCNSEGDMFSEPYDYRELLKLFTKDPNEFVEYIREKTVPVAYKASKRSPKKAPSVLEKLKQVETKQKSASPTRKRILELDEEDLGDSSDEYFSPEENQDNDDDLELDADPLSDEQSEPKSEPEVAKPKNPSTPRKKQKTQSSPTKSQTRSTSKSPSKSPSKKKDVEYMKSILSPLKKGYKIKPDLNAPSLTFLSPKKSGTPQLSSSSSQAFKEIKAKLHTSAKLSSLPGREDEMLQLLEKISTAIETETGSCVYVSGTPGVGKTATVREVIKQLQELSEDGDFKQFDYLEINGLKLLTPSVAYELLWKKISGINVSASNAAILLEKHFDTKRDNSRPLVVLMDELDQIVTKKQNVMYNFFNWPSYANSKLVVIAVANTMDLPERVLSNKISSRLGLNRIQFVGYTFDQLGEIIKHRLSMLTKQNKRKVIITDDAVGFASRKVASVSGDARRALTICRRAVEIAEKEYLEAKTQEEVKTEEEESFHVHINHISKAINETINSPISQFLVTLPFASKLFLQAVLLRMKRSGLAENSLGDIIDEMKNSLQLLTSDKGTNVLNPLGANITLLDLLYGNSLADSSTKLNIRSWKFKHLVNELVEYGILMQQNVPGERYRLIQLNISEEELSLALRRDKDILGDI